MRMYFDSLGSSHVSSLLHILWLTMIFSTETTDVRGSPNIANPQDADNRGFIVLDAIMDEFSKASDVINDWDCSRSSNSNEHCNTMVNSALINFIDYRDSALILYHSTGEFSKGKSVVNAIKEASPYAVHAILYFPQELLLVENTTALSGCRNCITHIPLLGKIKNKMFYDDVNMEVEYKVTADADTLLRLFQNKDGKFIVLKVKEGLTLSRIAHYQRVYIVGRNVSNEIVAVNPQTNDVSYWSSFDNDTEVLLMNADEISKRGFLETALPKENLDQLSGVSAPQTIPLTTAKTYNGDCVLEPCMVSINDNGNLQTKFKGTSGTPSDNPISSSKEVMYFPIKNYRLDVFNLVKVTTGDNTESCCKFKSLQKKFDYINVIPSQNAKDSLLGNCFINGLELKDSKREITGREIPICDNCIKKTCPALKSILDSIYQYNTNVRIPIDESGRYLLTNWFREYLVLQNCTAKGTKGLNLCLGENDKGYVLYDINNLDSSYYLDDLEISWESDTNKKGGCSFKHMDIKELQSEKIQCSSQLTSITSEWKEYEIIPLPTKHGFKCQNIAPQIVDGSFALFGLDVINNKDANPKQVELRENGFDASKLPLPPIVNGPPVNPSLGQAGISSSSPLVTDVSTTPVVPEVVDTTPVVTKDENTDSAPKVDANSPQSTTNSESKGNWPISGVMLLIIAILVVVIGFFGMKHFNIL